MVFVVFTVSGRRKEASVSLHYVGGCLDGYFIK